MQNDRSDVRQVERVRGAIIRGSREKRSLALCFTGHEFGESLPTILAELKRHGAYGSFFLTGTFLRNPVFQADVQQLVADGHYLGPHSDQHLHYSEGPPERRTLITRQQFIADVQANLAEVEGFGVPRAQVRYFIPPYETYNEEVAGWSAELGLVLINPTPGTLSGRDWTPLGHLHYTTTDDIHASIYRREAEDQYGLNGFLLLMHAGAGPGRLDKAARRLGGLLDDLQAQGYTLLRVDHLLDPVLE
ncbi:MAG: polysaccharide deacetylase family protein [Chloroflexi bacterium]|nr:polysaccharide deacetylase family protein [Chloroflexota bacterium]